MTEAEKFCKENNVKFRLSNIGENIGVVALEYINMLEKENKISEEIIIGEQQEINELKKQLEEENKELNQRIKELEFDVWEQKQYAGIYKSSYEKIRGARKNVEKVLDELKEKGFIKDWVYNHGYDLEVK